MRFWLVTMLALLPGCAGSELPATPPDAEQLGELRDVGRALFLGRGGCIECHRVGGEGEAQRGPDLTGVASRNPELPDAVYVAQSMVDPDALVVDGFAKGVMKRPDQPPIAFTDDEIVAVIAFLLDERARAADLDAAREQLQPLRTARDARKQHEWVERRLDLLRFDDADRKRGAALYAALGCGLCHENPELKVPSLRGVGKRLPLRELARWIIAPPHGTRMPSYEREVRNEELRDLCSHVFALENASNP